MGAPVGKPPRLACSLLALVLPPTPIGRSVLGDVLDEFHRRPAGLRRRLWFWWICLDIGLRYLPDRIRGRHRASTASAAAHSVSNRFRRLLSELGSDAIHAGRLARRHRVLVVAAAVNLAVALAVAVAAFSVLNGFWLRLYLAADPSIVTAFRHHDRGASSSWPAEELLEVRRRSKLATLEGAWAAASTISGTNGAPGEPVNVQFVTGTYLETHRAGAALGRLLGPADERPGSPPVVVLDHLFWRRQFGGDPAIVGRPIWVSGHTVSVIGVARRDFVDPTGELPHAWLPLSAVVSVMGSTSGAAALRLHATVRLASAVTEPMAESELTSLLTGLGMVTAGVPRATSVELTRSLAMREVSMARLVLLGVFVVVALVIGLASANVSNLLLAGTEARRHEIAIRLSLGASGARIRRQLATECVLLSVASGVAGFVLAGWLSPLLATFMGMEQTDTDPDARVILFTLLATTMSAIAGGMAPARQVRRHDVVAALKAVDGSAAATRQPGRTRAVLLSVQAAISIVLVVAAALFVRTLVHLAWLDPGFAVDRLVTVAATHTGEDRETHAREYWRLALERVRALPGVEAAALATFPPFATAVGDPTGTFDNATDADYFAVTGLRLIRGRPYTATEVAAAAPVAIISEQLATRYWADEDPLGTSLDRLPGGRTSFRGRTVIGIAADAHAVRLHDDATPFVYLPIASYTGARLVVRARDPHTSAAMIRDTLTTVSPSVEPTIMILADRYAREFARPRRLAMLAGVVGAFALALAGVGLAGATAFSVRRRTREIGIRLALGADRGRVMRQFVREGLRPVVIGLAIGLVGALLMGRLIAGLLHGLSAHDPLALAGATGVLLLSAIAAILVPLRRVVRLDPATVLRDQ